MIRWIRLLLIWLMGVGVGAGVMIIWILKSGGVK